MSAAMLHSRKCVRACLVLGTHMSQGATLTRVQWWNAAGGSKSAALPKKKAQNALVQMP